ncbi:alpha/beta hydrolase family protein [Galbibacter mesophilus]|uniref:alpha/beta hydrolase family protein n=1 Tax=Galbibacter mesophilus TaxID=379069 RepID=UPI00191E83C9|nr:alpha/beta hydrolase [Galbibacter mesophilus]MCM5663306.1 alpha/beta hydrolase [Galbibacter mesophilus]
MIQIKFTKIAKSILIVFLFVTQFYQGNAQSFDPIKSEEITFVSEGVTLAGTIYSPKKPHSSLVIVHGSGQEPRMDEFAKLLASNGICVLTYDKRGVGKSGGIYAGPEVGTNNIDSNNLNLLANDANAAVKLLQRRNKNTPIGLLGFSQAGWIISIAASKNPLIEFMILFSCPTITTLEQLRFQFYTDGRTDFWKTHTEEDAREHIKNDPDKYQFTATDPKILLNRLSIPGLWLFGEKDIQIPVKLCIEQLNAFKANGKPFEYSLFPSLGHNTAFSENTTPVEIALEWIKQKVAVKN